MATDAEVAAIIRQQIGRNTLMAVGGRNFFTFGNGYSGGKGRGLGMIVGSGTRMRRLLIALTPADLYDLTYEELGNRSPYRSLYRRHLYGIYADQLPGMVYDLVHHNIGHERRRHRSASTHAARLRRSRKVG